MPRKLFLIYAFTAIIPISGWAADVSTEIAGLKKDVLATKTENKELGHRLDAKHKSLETKISDLQKNFLAVKNELKTITTQGDEKSKSPQGASNPDKSIDQIAKATADNADLVIKFVGVIFSAVGLVGALVAFIGFKEFREIGKQRAEAQKALDSTVLLARASHSLLQASVMADDEKVRDQKKLRILAALGMIEELLKNGHDDPAIFNWQAFALKRLGQTEQALEAVENVFTKGKAKEGTFEYRRGLYNKACYVTLLAKSEEDKAKAYPLLQRAITRDYYLGQVALQDPDLSSLDQKKLRSLVDESI